MNFAHYDPTEFVILAVIFAAVIVCWIVYTRRLKTPPNVGTQEGIAIATEHRAHPEKSGRA